jgi:hypothetical protein
MYYNPTTKLLYVWDGSKWTPAERTTLGIASLYTYFPHANVDRLSGPDFYGLTPVFKARDTYEVHVNGVQLWPGDISSGGDYDIDFSVTPAELVFAHTLEDGDVVTLLELMKASEIHVPVGVAVVRLTDLKPQFDGILNQFLLAEAGGTSVSTNNGAEITLYIDGVAQLDGAGFTFTPPNMVTFDEPPSSNSVFVGVWTKGLASAPPPGTAVLPPTATTLEMMAGTQTAHRMMSPKLVADAIYALGGGGGSRIPAPTKGGQILISDTTPDWTVEDDLSFGNY